MTMARYKVQGILLRVLPYRESSNILYIFTAELGLLHGIVKGVRNRKHEKLFLERGMVIEAVIYTHTEQELHLTTSVAVLEQYQSIRTNLIKTALRDAAFETILNAIPNPNPHPELFQLFIRFLKYLNTHSENLCHPSVLWLFYYRFFYHMGCGIQLESCLACGNDFIEPLMHCIISEGGFICPSCNGNNSSFPLFYLPIRNYLVTGSPKPPQLHSYFTAYQRRNITWLFSDYCHYHFCGAAEDRTLHFLDEMNLW